MQETDPTVKEKSAASILSRPRGIRITAAVLAVVVILFVIISIYWSRTPDVFWVNHTIDDDRVVVGYSTTDTLVRVAETLSTLR